MTVLADMEEGKQTTLVITGYQIGKISSCGELTHLRSALAAFKANLKGPVSELE